MAAELHCTSKPHFMYLPLYKASILPFHTPDPVTIEWVELHTSKGRMRIKDRGSKVVRAAARFQGRITLVSKLVVEKS